MNETQQRVKTEVVEETSETLEVLRQERLPRPEKMQRENALLQGAHEVHFSERRVHVRDDIDLIRQAVDHLKVERRALPEARPPPPPPAPEPEPEPEAPQAQLTASERSALEKLVPGQILRIDTLYRTSAGHAVEVVFDVDGARRTDSFVLREGKAATVDDLGRVLDEIPLPVKTVPAEPTAAEPPVPAESPVTTPAEAPAAPAAPAETADEPTKKRRFGFGKKKDDTPAPGEAPAAEPAAPEEPKKKRFGFGGKKAADVPAPEVPASDAPAADGKKKRFGFGKKGAADAPATDAAPEPAADAAPEEGAGKKRRFGLGRGKK